MGSKIMTIGKNLPSTVFLFKLEKHQNGLAEQKIIIIHQNCFPAVLYFLTEVLVF
jgi:hypothetical protein